MAKLLPISQKPFSEYSEEDLRVFRSPSVEDYLGQIRRALALSALLHRTLSQRADDLAQFSASLERDASEALAELCEQAWASAEVLDEALPGETQTLQIVQGDDDVDAEEGGA